MNIYEIIIILFLGMVIVVFSLFLGALCYTHPANIEEQDVDRV